MLVSDTKSMFKGTDSGGRGGGSGDEEDAAGSSRGNEL